MARRGTSRIIPARAGFTSPLPTSDCFIWDHPRSRGVYAAGSGTQRCLIGSSPLARGLLVEVDSRTMCTRIIPARAGFTQHYRRGGRPREDHPRSRGVYLLYLLRRLALQGSSPLARGLPIGWKPSNNDSRIIPARAGFTFSESPGTRHASDHPRSRGVYGMLPTLGVLATGSSPLARGLLYSRELLVQWRRIIPARAGFTLLASHETEIQKDHPRSRGVYTCGSLESQR